MIETDHKPLVSIFIVKQLDDLSPRLQRFRHRMMRYCFDIKYISGKDLVAADTLSRAPIKTDEVHELGEEVEAHLNLITSNFPASDQKLIQIRDQQLKDPVLQKVTNYMKTFWPEKTMLSKEELLYFHVREELGIHNGLLLRNCRLVIPSSLQQEMLL
ncbi:unnamed protein product, partial [Allacma fusca]